MATTELTSFQEKLLGSLIASLRLNEGFPDESLLTDYEKRDREGIRAPEKLPRPIKKGEKVWISTAIHHEIGLIYSDETWARPTEMFFYQDDDTLDGKRPVPVRAVNYRYDLDAGYRYPLKPYSDVPMTVVRRIMEVWEGSGGVRKMERVDLKVRRVLYGERGGKHFSPYRLVCVSEYAKAPQDFVNPYGETSQEMWVEKSRVFESEKGYFPYIRSGGVLKLGGEPAVNTRLVELGKLPESLGEAELVFLSAKRSPHGI